MQIALVVANETTVEPCTVCGNNFDGEFGFDAGYPGYIQIDTKKPVCEDCAYKLEPKLGRLDSLLNAAANYKNAVSLPGLVSEGKFQLKNTMTIAEVQRRSRHHSPVGWFDDEGNEVPAEEGIVIRCDKKGQVQLYYEVARPQRIQAAMGDLLRIASQI